MCNVDVCAWLKLISFSKKKIYTTIQNDFSLPEIWPTTESLIDVIGKSEDYKNYCEWRTENPQFEKEYLCMLSNHDLLLRLCKSVISVIEERWIESQKEILDVNIIIRNYNRATANRGSDNNNNILETYFKHLEQKWVDKLYYKGGIYDLKTLDEMIPHSNSNLFCRQRIMARYMEQMNKLKPRGEEWEMIILSLWEEIERETIEEREDR